VPRVPADRRLVVDALGYADDGITHVTVRFGYMETPEVLGALRMLDPAATEGRLQLDEASYFVSKIELQRGDAPTMASWRKRLFIAPRTSPPTLSTSSACLATAPSSWARTSRYERPKGPWRPRIGVASILTMRSVDGPNGQDARSFVETARRQQIVECAIDAIAEVGYGRASLAEVARRAGVSKSLLLYHFAGKDELVDEVVRAVYERRSFSSGPPTRGPSATGVAAAIHPAVRRVCGCAAHRPGGTG